MNFIKLRIIYLVAFLVLLSVPATAKEAGTISGIALDKDTRRPLVGANVILKGTEMGAACGLDGKFIIRNAPKGTYQLIISMIGYEVQTLEGVSVEPSSVIELEISLKSRPIEMKGITIFGKEEKELKEEVRVSTRNLKITEIKDMAGVAGDVLRAVQVLPGVIARSDFTSQLYVRGGSPDQNLIMVDNVEVFNPYRLKMFGGPISMFNPDVVERVELISGGFPAEYGDKLSAVLLVKNKDGNRSRVSSSGSVSLIDAKYFIEGPLYDFNGAWLFATRRTYYDMLLNRLVGKGFIFPYFRDLQGKLFYTLTPNQTIRINVLDSNEGMLIKDLEPEEGEDELFDDITGKFSLEMGVDDNLYSIGWVNIINDRLFSELTLSQYDDFWSLRATYEPEYFDVGIDMKRRAMREDITYLGFSSHEIKGGLQIADIITDITVKIKQDSLTYYLTNPGDRRQVDSAYVERKFGFQKASSITAGYIQDTWRINPLATIQAGIRADHSSFTDKWIYSPRFSSNFMLDDKTALRFAFGYFYQAPNFTTLFERNIDWNIFETIKLNNEKAMHYLTGVERSFLGGFTAKLEGYYKSLDNLVVPTDSLGNFIPKNTGKGYAKGFEFFLEKKSSPNAGISGWISYSYIITKEKDSDKEWFHRDFDQRHTISTIVNLKLFAGLSTHLKFIYGSGFPWTPLEKVDHICDENGDTLFAIPTWGNKNSSRYPPYQRLDVRLDWEHKFKDFGLSVYIEIINAFDHRNVYEYYWTEDYKTRLVAYMLPRLPYFGISINF